MRRSTERLSGPSGAVGALRHGSEVPNDEDLEPIDPDLGGEVASTALRAALSMVPVAGPLVDAAVFGSLQVASHQRELRFINALGVKVREIESRLDGWTVAQITSDEDFLAAWERALRAMREDASEEKRRYLLNAVGNAGSWGTEPELVRSRFVDLTARYSPLHVELLVLFRNPASWFVTQGIAVPDLLGGTVGQLLRDYAFTDSPLFPEEVGRSMAELGSDGLLDDPGLQTVARGSALLESRITPLGARYLAFIEAEPTE